MSDSRMEEPMSGLVPRLRFPEFHNEPSWTQENLSRFLTVTATYGIVKAGEFLSSGVPMVRGGDIKDGTVNVNLPLVSSDIHQQYKRTMLQEGDVLISLVGYPGEAAVIPKQLIGANISRAVGLIRLKDTLDAKYLVNYLNSPQGRAAVLNPSAGSAQVVVNLRELNKLTTPLPGQDEQRKIAAGLSSLDALIAVQTNRLDALKTHKKGLMQQLFPREGETVPRLRFPEFREAGEWEEKMLGKLLSIGNGRDHKHLPEGDIPVYGSGGYMRSVNEHLHDGESVCIGRKGTIDNPVFLTGKFWTVDTLFYTHSFQDCLPFFIYLIFQNINWSNHNEAGGVPSLSKTNIAKIPVLVPEIKEQRKIAACLSSLDALITAQADKLDALKTHKKGLMQQLFPSLETAEA